MPVNSHEPAGPASPPGRLYGWKDIANHLGKGVRTVQRWEREYYMPVHRLGRDGGEIVFAYRDELDAWLARADKARSETRAEQNGAAPASPVDLAPGAAQAAFPTPAKTSRPISAFWIFAIVLAAIGSLALFTIARGPGTGRPSDTTPKGSAARNPASAEFRENVLAILDERGDLLWTKYLSAPIAENPKLDPQDPGRYVHIADLDGNGSTEVISRPPVPPGGVRPVEVLNGDGSPRFNHGLPWMVRATPCADPLRPRTPTTAATTAAREVRTCSWSFPPRASFENPAGGQPSSA